MRRNIIVALATVVVAAVAAPGASAATATFNGTCAFTGKSTFNPPLTSEHQLIQYDFQSGSPAEGEPDNTKCSGTLNGKSVTDVPVVAKVAGEGDLSCSSGESTTPGKGSIVFPDGSTFLFDFTFSAIITEVDFVASYGNGATAKGHASFADYVPPTAVVDCGPSGSGIKELGFTAETEMADKPFEGTKPDDAGGGENTGGGDTGGGKEKPTKAEKRKACMKKAKKIKNKSKRKKALKRCKRIK